MAPRKIPTRTVERLSRYRRILKARNGSGAQTLFSHELAALAAVTAAQVRRDLMSIGCTGGSNYGYRISDLLSSIAGAIDGPGRQRVALVGAGHLGVALIGFVDHYCPNLEIAAAFDTDPGKIGRVFHGVRVYGDDSIPRTVADLGIEVAIVSVPGDSAQEVVDRLVLAGVTGILNFAPITLRAPLNVFVEPIDMTVALEKVAYFTRQHSAGRKER